MKEFDKSSMKRDNPELNFELKFSENKKGLKKIYAVGIRLNI